jgi:hypothetical protein
MRYATFNNPKPKKVKFILALIITLSLATNCFSQNVDSLQKKFSNKVCSCMGAIESYEKLKPRIDECYDKIYNFIFNDATAEETKFYVAPGNLKIVVQKFEYYLKSTCPEVVRVINEYVKPKDTTNSYPVNFRGNDLKTALSNSGIWENNTIAFNGEIIKIVKTIPNKLFLKVKLNDGGSVWVGDMTNSKFSTLGNKLRFIGYYIQAEKDQAEQNEQGFIVISFGSLDLSSKQKNMYPGSEKQIYEWANGRVPKSVK